MVRIFLFILTMSLILSCSKSDSEGSLSSETNNSNSPETFGEWSPSFTDQTNNFVQSRTGSNGTNETREINVNSNEQVDISKEKDLDINKDGDNYDIITETTSTYTASEGLGSFSSSGIITVKSDIDIEIKNEGLVDIDISEISSGQIKLVANPSSGFRFLGWDGPSVSVPKSSNPLVLLVDYDKQIKANFLNIIDPDFTDIGFHADSIYSKIDPNSLLSYVDAFILDAERYGLDLTYVRDHCYNIVIEEFVNIVASGATMVGCVDTQVRVMLNKADWEQNIQPFLDHSKGFYKDPYMFGFHLIWHELGHDILNLQHTCNETPNFLNHPSKCANGNKILQYTSDMLWFTDDTNPEKSQENKGFHRAVSNYYNLINQNPNTVKYTSTTHGDIPCPVPSSATWTREIGDWRYTQQVGEDSYAQDWCYSKERTGSSNSEFIGGSRRKKTVQQFNNYNLIECNVAKW
tara:strand:+ start:3616 stop:5004 length:1389 start_codon:yes stop_codon:yes gene_type:complete